MLQWHMHYHHTPHHPTLQDLTFQPLSLFLSQPQPMSIIHQNKLISSFLKTLILNPNNIFPKLSTSVVISPPIATLNSTSSLFTSSTNLLSLHSQINTTTPTASI